MGTFFPSLTALKGAYFVEPKTYYLKEIITSYPVFFWVIIIFGILSFKNNNKRLLTLCVTWFLPFFIIITFVPKKTMRYSMPVLPALALMLGMIIDGIIRTIDEKFTGRVRSVCLSLPVGARARPPIVWIFHKSAGK